MNADRMTGDAVQALMRHKSYPTTQRYINIARQLDQTGRRPYVPNLQLKKAAVDFRGVFFGVLPVPSRRNEKSPATGKT